MPGAGGDNGSRFGEGIMDGCPEETHSEWAEWPGSDRDSGQSSPGLAWGCSGREGRMSSEEK